MSKPIIKLAATVKRVNGAGEANNQGKKITMTFEVAELFEGHAAKVFLLTNRVVNLAIQEQED